MKRIAAAQWNGSPKQGLGKISTESGYLSDAPYTWAQRFGEDKGTNPEELVGAAHSACFAMAMASELEKMGLTANSINVRAEVFMEKSENGWGIPEIHLNVSADVPGASPKQISEAADITKHNCPISKVLNASVSVDIYQAAKSEQVTEVII